MIYSIKSIVSGIRYNLEVLKYIMIYYCDVTYQPLRVVEQGNYLPCDFTQYHMVSFMIEDTLIF